MDADAERKLESHLQAISSEPLVIQMEKMRPREGQGLTPGHTACPFLTTRSHKECRIEGEPSCVSGSLLGSHSSQTLRH